mgnify:CR=1 FL=1
MIVNGTEVTIKNLEGVSEQEILAYMDYIHQDNPSEEIDTLELSPAEDGSVALEYTLRPQKFQRIRRITGYLVGTIDRWNNAKRAEEHDRVKHGLREASAS